MWPPQHAISIGTYKYLHLSVPIRPEGHAVSSCIRCEAICGFADRWGAAPGLLSPVILFFWSYVILLLVNLGVL